MVQWFGGQASNTKVRVSSLDKKLGSASTLSTQMYKILGTSEILLCVTPSWRGSVGGDTSRCFMQKPGEALC